MRIEAQARVLVAILLLLMVPSSQVVADPVSDPDGSASSTPAETPSSSSTADGDKKSTEGSGSPVEPFIPTETIPADSAISFPVDI